MSDLGELDAVATAAGIAAGDLDPAVVVEEATNRTRVAAERIGGVAAPLFAAARARVSDTLPHGPLAGVPTAVKEIVGLVGAPFGNGSRAWHGHRATRTDPAARQHLATGLVAVATTTMSEFGLAPTTEPLGYPTTRNPWAPAHTAGGSSGGSAALVAAGAVPLAFSTDGAGSIRIPAACCGVVGMKPSRGRMASLGTVDRTPVPLSVHGVIARTVRDVAAYHAAAEQVAPAPAGLRPIGDVTHPHPRRLRIGVATADPDGRTIDRDVVHAVEDAAGVFDDLGHDVRPVVLPSTGGAGQDLRDYFAFLAALIDAYSRHEVGGAYDPSLRDPWTRHMARHGRRTLPRLPAIVSRLRAAAAEHRALFGGLDVVLSPVTTAPAPPLGHLSPLHDPDVLYDRIDEWLGFTPIQNVAGTPAIALPSTPARTGLPIGVQLAGLVGDEARLLSLALELEDQAPWPLGPPAPLD